jgi:hypothetical protein
MLETIYPLVTPDHPRRSRIRMKRSACIRIERASGAPRTPTTAGWIGKTDPAGTMLS